MQKLLVDISDFLWLQSCFSDYANKAGVPEAKRIHDVAVFVPDPRELDIWFRDYFHHVLSPLPNFCAEWTNRPPGLGD